jgi:hypothetical protein
MLAVYAWSPIGKPLIWAFPNLIHKSLFVYPEKIRNKKINQMQTLGKMLLDENQSQKPPNSSIIQM